MQARFHRGAGAGLALLGLLVGVGGDAGGVGRGFLAEAPGDAGVPQPQTQAGGRQIIQQFGRGYACDVLAVEAEGLDDGIAQGRCFLTDRLAEAIGHRPFLIPPEGVLEERREQPRTKQRPTQLTQRQGVQPLPTSQLQRGQPGVEHHEKDAGQGEGDGEQGGFESTEAVVEGHGMIGGHVRFYYNTLYAVT